MRAVRFGIQGILDYLNPASGMSVPLMGVTTGVVINKTPTVLTTNEADLIELARQARDEEDI